MMKYFGVLLIVLHFSLQTTAQEPKNTAPVKWEAYRDTEFEFSILLPKLPVKMKSSDFCRETESSTYAAYADEAVYKITVSAKSKKRAPDWCQSKQRFGRIVLDDRLAEIRTKTDLASESKQIKDGREVLKLMEKYTSYWLFDDTANGRIVELSMTHRDGDKLDDARFVNSLAFDLNLSGKSIGEGSERTLGDEIPTDTQKDSKLGGVETDIAVTDRLMIVFKPRASYTDSARKNNVQGTVRLKVTLLPNGSVGNITPIFNASPWIDGTID